MDEATHGEMLREGYERVFRAHHGAVHGYVLRRVEPSGVEDVVEEVFLVAWRRFDSLTREADALPWLLGIARRTCANHLRARARRTALGERLERESLLRAGSGHDPAWAESSGDAQGRGLMEALASLGDGDREALLLIAWEGLEDRQAAAVLGCTIETFAVRLHRARRRLARALAGHEPARGASDTHACKTKAAGEVAHEIP